MAYTQAPAAPPPAAVFEPPLLQAATQKFCDGVDGLMNGLIEKVGGAMDKATDAGREKLAGMCAAGAAKVADGAGNLTSKLTPQGGQEKSAGLAKSPEKEIEAPSMARVKESPTITSQAMAATGGASFACVSCSASDMGQFSAPSAVNYQQFALAQTQAQHHGV